MNLSLLVVTVLSSHIHILLSRREFKYETYHGAADNSQSHHHTLSQLNEKEYEFENCHFNSFNSSQVIFQSIQSSSTALPLVRFRISLLYLQNDALMVLARFDLGKTWREFLISFSVPATLFVISFISLCIITRSVKVGDDAKMRCKYCTEGEENSDIEENLANSGVRLDPAAVEQALIDADAIAGTSKV